MNRFTILLLTFFICNENFAQDCNINEGPPASCNCDDCDVINENWVLTSSSTNVCEGELFEIEAEFSNPNITIDYFRWAVYTLDFSETLIDTTIYSNNIFQYLIDLGDIEDCAGNSPQIDFWLNLIAYTDECSPGIVSCHNTLKPLTVVYKPRANFNSDIVECINEQVTVSDQSCFAETYEWDFNNDGIVDSTDPNPNYSFDTPGSYPVSLTVTNECGSDTRTRSVIVVDYPEAEIDFNIPGGNICNPDYLSLILNSNEWVTGPSGNFQWAISPAYTNMNGSFCFVNQDSIGTLNPCLHDSIFSQNTLDSLLSLEIVDLYFSDPGEYTITLDYENVCESLSTTSIINVYEPVVVSGISSISECDEAQVCFDDLSINVSGDSINAYWIFTNGSIPSSSSLDFGCITFQESGTMTLTVEANDPCLDNIKVIDVNIIETQSVSISDPSPSTICQNAGLIDLFPSSPGGTYIYNGSEATFISNNQLDPSNLSPGVYNVTYVLSDNPECPAEDDFSFTILEGPFIELGDSPTFCEEVVNFNPVINIQGGDIDAWLWTFCNSAGATVFTSMNENPQFSSSTPNIYTIKLELTSFECGVVLDTSELIVQQREIAIIDPFNNPYCQGSSPDTLTAMPPGGTWSGSGITDDVLGIFDPSNLNPNDYTITYSIENGVCSSMIESTITVVASEQVIVNDTFACITDPIVSINFSPSGGQFFGAGIVDNANGSFNPSIAGQGSHQIIYDYIDVNNCIVSSVFNIEVDSIPQISIRDTVFVCIGNEDIILQNILNINTNNVVGTYDFSGPGIIDPISGLFNGNSLNPGFYTYYVNFITRSCSVLDSFVIELDEKPLLILSPDTTVCISDSIFLLEANLGPGTWSSDNCIIDPITGEVNLNQSGGVDCSVQYIFSEGTSCEQIGNVELSIIDLQNEIIVPNNMSICFLDGIFTIPNFGPLGGEWSGLGIIDLTDGIIDVSQLESDANYTYRYCIESLDIDCYACKEFTLFIEPLPITNFSVVGSPCINDSFDLMNNNFDSSVTYLWDFGDGNSSNDPNPSHLYNLGGDYDISVIATTTFGCKDTFTQSVHVTNPPILDLIITTEEGCAPLEIEYSNNSSGENIDQYWVIDAVDTLFNSNSAIVLDSVFSDSIITLELVVFNECDTLKQSKDILVHPYPIVDFGIQDDEGCSPDTVFFMNITLGLPDNFMWDFGNGITSDSIDPLPQIYTSPEDSISIYIITLEASNMCGEDELTKEITVYPNNVEAFFEIDTLMGCPPLAVQIKNYATVGSTVSYDFGDGGTGTTPDTTYVYTEPGEYVITQYAALCGQDSIKSDTITVYPLPIVEFSAPTFVCVGDTINFVNNSVGALASQWHFGDGSMSLEFAPNHVYNEAGTYEVSLIMFSNSYLCPDTLSKIILVPELPNAGFGFEPNAICPNDTIQFQNQSIGALNYEWDFGDDSGSNEENPEHIYSISGTYEVSLIAYDEFNCIDDTTDINVLVYEMPTADFELNQAEVCQFHDTIIINNTSEGFINSMWFLNDDLVSEQENDIAIWFDEAVVQNIELVVTNGFGCTDTTSNVFDVLPSPIAMTNFIDTSGCEGETFNFINLSQNSDQTIWIFDEANSSVDSLVEFSFQDSGIYNALLVALNSNNCPSDTVQIDIEIFSNSIAMFEIVDFDSCGFPKDIFFENLSENTNDYEWDFGNSQTSNIFEPNTTFADAGNYLISLISNNQYNCPDTITELINIYPQPIADIEIPNCELCANDTLFIINNSQNATHFNYYLNDLLDYEFPIIIYDPGVYEFQFIANFEDVCIDTFPGLKTVNVYETPIADFSFFSNESDAIIGDVRFVNQSQNSNSYLWEFGDQNSSTEENPIHEYDINGPINVCLTAFNTNSGVQRCEDKFFQTIDFEIFNKFFVPNALSPDNNFGEFEVGIFKPKGSGIEEYELNIFAPWGDKIITLNKVENEQPIDYWDGRFKNEPVPQGSYLWTARIKFRRGGGDDVFRKGTVTVIR
ncbi:MAG: PKD domain-containing protein [Saprospiraceae bacterium]|nr:PKD domain-containing protein [Saprospiraceae bacterium]